MARLMSTALLVFLMLGGYSQAQQSETKQDPAQNKVFRVNVDLVQVDAVVTDSEGRPVDDLKAEDFVVLQDGKPQELASFSMVRMRKPVVSQEAASLMSELKDGIAPPLPPPVELKKENVRRTIALIVDDLGLSYESTVRVRNSLRQWVDTRMQEGDLVAIVMTGSGMGSLQQFTTDKRMLYAAIERVVYNGLSRVGGSAFLPKANTADFYSNAAEAIKKESILLPDGIEAPLPPKAKLADPYSDTEEEIELGRILGTLGSIRSVLNGIGHIPGRKSLVLFSENLGLLRGRVTYGADGFISSTGYNGAREIIVREVTQNLIDEANLASVVIHAIDPRGIVYTGLMAEDSLYGVSKEEDIEVGLGGISGDRTLDYTTSQDGMVKLTQLTGGLFEQNRNDIANALQEVAEDGEVYYLLGYKPDAKTASRMREGKRLLHTLNVQVKREDLQVRSRSGFFGNAIIPEEPPTRRQRIDDALVSPFASDALPVRLTALFSQAKDEKFYINALLHFDTDRLTFTEEDGWSKAAVDIVASTFDAKGKQVDLEHKSWSVQAKGKTLEEMQKYGVVFLMRIPVKKEGPYQMRAVVSDAASGLLGSASQFIEVPKANKGLLALSGIALSEETKQIGAVADQQEGMVADKSVKGTVAMRVFEPGDTITWAYQILNAKAGQDRKSQLQTYVRLFHKGREVYSADTNSLTLERLDAPGRMIGTGRMELQKIAPGHYTLQVIVRDMLAKEEHRTAVQTINFEILNPKLALKDSGITPR